LYFYGDVMRNEIELVRELTGAVEEQIKLHDDGYWSRAYVVNRGEFVVKFPKYDTVTYENEAMFLNLINTLTLPINTQKLKWLSNDKRCIVIYGVRGTPLSEIKILALSKNEV